MIEVVFLNERELLLWLLDPHHVFVGNVVLEQGLMLVGKQGGLRR